MAGFIFPPLLSPFFLLRYRISIARISLTLLLTSKSYGCDLEGRIHVAGRKIREKWTFEFSLVKNLTIIKSSYSRTAIFIFTICQLLLHEINIFSAVREFPHCDPHLPLLFDLQHLQHQHSHMGAQTHDCLPSKGTGGKGIFLILSCIFRW